MSRRSAARPARSMRVPSAWLIACATAALAACGGGSNDDADLAAADTAGPVVEQEVEVDALAERATAGAVAAPYAISLSRRTAPVLPGRSVTFDVVLDRQAGFDGAVRVALRGLPTGTRAARVTIPAGETRARIVVRAAVTAPHSLPTRVSVHAVDGESRVAAGSIVVTVRGRAGDVDTSFGSGVVVTPVEAGEDYARALAVQPDGKVIAVGSTVRPTTGTDVAVLRYGRDGGLDRGFGTRGKVALAISPEGGSDRAAAVAVQADGRIVVAGDADMGASREDFALARFLPDGTPDRSFGRRGKVTTAFQGDSSDRVQALAIQPDGKIVVGGVTYSGAQTHLDFALARYLPNGRLDTSFGHGGKVVTPAAEGAVSDGINAITLQEVEGELCIVAVGGEGGFIVTRHRSDGRLDTRFGQGGIVRNLFPQYIGAAQAVTTTPDGKLIVTGHIDHDFATVQLRADGSLDKGFNGDGRVVTPVSSTNWDEATAVVRQSDGRIVIGGWVYKGAGSAAQFAALRYTAAGELDAGFGSGGIVIPPVSGDNRTASGRALVLQSDRRVPTVRAIQGGERNESNHDFALLRYWL